MARAMKTDSPVLDTKGQGIEVERFGHIPENIAGRGGESTFFAPKGEAQLDFGAHKTSVTINPSAKLYHGSSSYAYAIDKGLMNRKIQVVKDITGLDTLQQVHDAEANGIPPESGASIEFQRDPNLRYTAFQQVAKMELKKEGYQGAKWRSEDDLNPTQFQIWDRDAVQRSREVCT